MILQGDGVNDAPALSAAQVGIAVEGATDAAKNAADLILTEPGLSPIYGAVLESRRIFARIKSYVVYRVAASAILVLVLSTIIFATGCAVNSLLVIILALLNDISMIPVAYDNAQATKSPQLPDSGKLVLMSLYYAMMHTAAGLCFIFIHAHNEFLKHALDLNNNCNNETQGFIWLYLVLVTELAIFSVRAPNFFWQSMPSPFLIASVFLTCAVGTIIAVMAMGVDGQEVIWLWLFNLIMFVLIDFGKVVFKNIIHDAAAEVITSDELVEVGDKPKSEATKNIEKRMRYIGHKKAARSPSGMAHTVFVSDVGSGAFSQVLSSFTQLRHDPITDAYNRNNARAGRNRGSEFMTKSAEF